MKPLEPPDDALDALVAQLPDERLVLEGHYLDEAHLAECDGCRQALERWQP